MTGLSAMVFAAGFGTRMGALTRNCPKALIPVGGTTLLDRTLALVAEAGIGRVVVNAHYLGGRIEAHLAGRDIRVSLEEPEILDTGGGLKAALPLLGADPVFTANSDAVFDGPNPFGTLRAAWDPEGMEALLLLAPLQRAVGRRQGGDFALAPDGRLRRGGDFVYTGVQILRTQRVAAHSGRVFSLNRIWSEMEAAGGLFGTVHPGRWCDVGHPEGIALAEGVLEERGV